MEICLWRVLWANPVSTGLGGLRGEMSIEAQFRFGCLSTSRTDSNKKNQHPDPWRSAPNYGSTLWNLGIVMEFNSGNFVTRFAYEKNDSQIYPSSVVLSVKQFWLKMWLRSSIQNSSNLPAIAPCVFLVPSLKRDMKEYVLGPWKRWSENH